MKLSKLLAEKMPFVTRKTHVAKLAAEKDHREGLLLAQDNLRRRELAAQQKAFDEVMRPALEKFITVSAQRRDSHVGPVIRFCVDIDVRMSRTLLEWGNSDTETDFYVDHVSRNLCEKLRELMRSANYLRPVSQAYALDDECTFMKPGGGTIR